ncbi:hypothetical protein [Roseicyclus marinus]|uniref:hypothetical protein n=1 Tax=Roseicyclus marinus TaxID=2161673 RepID=UPI00240EE16E|nr:hypothetical protein [Roseicyclus marinus]MDG3041752.1 hypothetical protein [Roseicyclus marinus]
MMAHLASFPWRGLRGTRQAVTPDRFGIPRRPTGLADLGNDGGEPKGRQSPARIGATRTEATKERIVQARFGDLLREPGGPEDGEIEAGLRTNALPNRA